MVMIPPLAQDAPLDDPRRSTARPVAARMVRTQRRYASNFNISFMYEPPGSITKPSFPAPESTFDKWRAAAVELDLHGGDLGKTRSASMAVLPQRTLHDALLGTTAVLLLGVLGGIGYIVWSGAVPVAAARDGTASTGSRIASLVQPLVDLAAKEVAQAVPNLNPSFPSARDVAADVPASRMASDPVAPLPALSAIPDRLALAMASAVKPASTVPQPPASDASAGAADAVLMPEQEAAGPVARIMPSEPDTAPPAPTLPPTLPVAMGDAGPMSGRVTAAAVPSATLPGPDATPPASAARAAGPVVELTAAPKASLAFPLKLDTPPSAVAAVTVRLLPPPEWTGAAAPALVSPSEAGAPPVSLPTPPDALSAPVPAAEPTPVPVVTAKVVPPGVSQQNPLAIHGESLRSRMEMATLARAVRVRAWRLKLAEARIAAAMEADAGGPQTGLPAPTAGAGGGLRAAAAMPQQVLRGLHVQKGSPDAAVLSVGPEQANQHFVMVGDQLPGIGRVIAILPRGGSWIVRTERGVIR